MTDSCRMSDGTGGIRLHVLCLICLSGNGHSFRWIYRNRETGCVLCWLIDGGGRWELIRAEKNKNFFYVAPTNRMYWLFLWARYFVYGTSKHNGHKSFLARNSNWGPSFLRLPHPYFLNIDRKEGSTNYGTSWHNQRRLSLNFCHHFDLPSRGGKRRL